MFHLKADTAQHHFEASALAPDTFHVVRFAGEERISQLFRFEVELLSKDPDVELSSVTGQPATLILARDPEPIQIHGLVADFQQGGRTADRFGYRAVLVPRLWLLSLSYGNRIFQQQSVKDIVAQVLQDGGLGGSDFRFELQGSYAPREYCVQYEETDLNFVSRLLEYEGIRYYFEQGEQDVLVMTDDPASIPPVPGDEAVLYNPSGGLVAEQEAVREFVCQERLVTGTVVLKDYNDRTPETELQAESQINADMPGRRYEYGPHFKTKDEGKRLAKVRNEEIECQRRVMVGESNCRLLTAGHKFDLAEHFRRSLNGTYLITGVRHTGEQGGALPGFTNSKAEGPTYRNAFTCIPADVPYRPPREAPVPRIPGLLTSRTETAGGEYAYIDEDGRYRLKLNFDLSDAGGGEASLPVRKAQDNSGPGFGIHFPEHANTEMIVACLNGDPDRPLALGTVPNPSQQSPSVSTNKQQNVIRTWGQNELTFDDTKGSENIFLHATKDHTVNITNDESITVGHDQAINIGNNRDKIVGADQSETVGANKTINVGGNHTETIGGGMAQTVGGSKAETIAIAKALSVGAAYQVSVGAAMNETVGGAKTEEVGAFKGEAVGGNKSEGIGGSKSLSVGKSFTVSIGKNQAITIGTDLTEEVGGKHVEQVTKDYALSAKNIQLLAEDQIVLKTGSAQIIMKKNGDIEIKGKKIQVKGSGDVVIKGSKVKQN